MRWLQLLWLDWALRAFGYDHVANRKIRVLRIVEEVIELAQAEDVDIGQVRKCVELVYSKPSGEVLQEIGGVIGTLAVYCQSINVSIEDALGRELRRVLSKPPEYFAKRNQDKIDQGL